jgi:CHAT domain-containing protein/tetratricopeptide (TPR) repeat protein
MTFYMYKIYYTLRSLILFSSLIFISFTDDNNRIAINRQYQELIPSLKKEPLKALPLLEKLREQAEKTLDAQDTLLANILFSNGKIYLDQGINADKALLFNEKALKIRLVSLLPNHPKLAQSFHNTAMLLYARGRYALAKQYATEAVRIKTAQPIPDSMSLMYSFHQLEINNQLLGAYDEALEAAYKTRDLAIVLKNTFYLGNSHLTIGNVQFFRKNYNLAADEYKIAYSFFTESAKTDPSILVQKNSADCLTNLGIVMQFLNKHDVSLSYLEKAKNSYLSLFSISNDSSLINQAANCIFESGNTLAESSNTEGVQKALQRYDEAIILFGNKQSLYAVECWKARGDLLQKNNRVEEALQSYQKATGVLLGDEPDVMKNPLINDLIAPELLDAFAAKAQLLYTMYPNSAGFDATFEALNKCDTIISRLMTNYDTDNSKYFLAEKVQPIYAQAIKTAYILSQNKSTETARFYQNAALNFCEKNKAIVLMDNLKDRRAKNFGGIPPTLLATERDLKSDIAFAQKELYDAPDSLKSGYQNALFEAKQAFSAFQKDLEKQFPKYFDLKYQAFTPLSIDALQNRLDDNTAAIEYFIADSDVKINEPNNTNNSTTNTKNTPPSNVKLQTSNLYIFTFSKGNCQIFEKKLPPQYNADFQAFRRSLSDEKWISDSAMAAKAAFLNNGFSLYQTLLETPLAFLKQQKNGQNINRLRIIPDGSLGYLPFEMLLTNSHATDWKGKTTPYLIRDYAVSYAYSARLLDDNERTDGRNFGGFGIEYDEDMLKHIAKDSSLPRSSNAVLPSKGAVSSAKEANAVAPFSRGNVLSPLVFADDEVRNIGQLLGSTTIFLNEAATKSAFLKNAPNYGILHLAMHGAIDERNPLNSGLIFSKNSDSTNNYLSGYDLFGQQLKAGLAVLSACNTGNGELRRGEGVMSLARAFAFAGCPSTVMSLWSIPDESTSQVMLNFYTHLKEGDPKDVALQKAKLDYLQKCPPQYQVPNYWGATVIIGNIAPVDFKEWYQKPLFIGGSFTLLLLGFGIYTFKNKLIKNKISYR